MNLEPQTASGLSLRRLAFRPGIVRARPQHTTLYIYIYLSIYLSIYIYLHLSQSVYIYLHLSIFIYFHISLSTGVDDRHTHLHGLGR